MAVSISNQYLEPGTYIKVANVAAPNPIGGSFIPIFIGLGRKEYDVSVGIVRDDADTKDLITDEFTVVDILSVVDSLGVVYTKDADYKLYANGTDYYVEWENPVSLTGTIAATTFAVNGKTIKINIDGVSFTTTFTTADPIPVATVVSEINAAYVAAGGVGSPATVATNAVKLTGSTLAYVENGTALAELGFIVGQKIQAFRPADGVTYNIIYKRMKVTTDYTAKLFSRLEDVYAECGPYAYPTTLVTGSPTNQTSSTLVDTAADLSTVELGHYVKITGGVGAGQIRVITSVNTATFTVGVSPNWDVLPDGNSTYAIYDGSINEISIAATITQNHGAVNFLVSQSAEDIVDDNNFRLAIDNTKELVDGLQGWCLVYLKGVDVNDSIVSYIKAYITEMNNPINKQERMALLGIKSTVTQYTDVISLTSGINDARIGVIANPSATITGIGTLDGSYIASAVAGIVCNPNNDPGEPITGKVVLFDTVEDPWYRSEKRQMGGAGAIIIEKQGVDNKILHYLSTRTSDIIDSELKVIRQIDDIKKTLKTTLNAALLNIRVADQRAVIAMADSFIQLIMQSKVDSQFIADYDRNVDIRFNTTDARELQISIKFLPAFDLNYITITLGATIRL